MAIENNREEVDRDSESVNKVDSTGLGQLACHRESEGKSLGNQSKNKGCWLGSLMIPLVRLETLDVEEVEGGMMIVASALWTWRGLQGIHVS